MKLTQYVILPALLITFCNCAAEAADVKTQGKFPQNEPLTATFITCSAYEAASAEQASDCYRHVVELAAKSYDASKFSRLEEASYMEGALDGARDLCNLGKAFVKDHPRNNFACTLKFNKEVARLVVKAFESGTEVVPFNPALN